MPTYTANFRTDAEFDVKEFEADTPAQALQMARELVERDPEAFAFETYDMLMPIDEIEISGPEGGELAVWLSDDLRLRLAARDLLQALEAIASMQKDGEDGFDLSNDAAVDALHDAIELAREAIAKAKPSKVPA